VEAALLRSIEAHVLETEVAKLLDLLASGGNLLVKTGNVESTSLAALVAASALAPSASHEVALLWNGFLLR
jgi:hypothetical protein